MSRKLTPEAERALAEAQARREEQEKLEAELEAQRAHQDDEAEAVRAACDLLEKMGGLDEEKKADIETRMAAGERVLTAQEPPKWESRCEACGAGLVSEKTTETCLACGGSGERGDGAEERGTARRGREPDRD